MVVVTAGNVVVTAGSVVVTAGIVVVTAGRVLVTAGKVLVTLHDAGQARRQYQSATLSTWRAVTSKTRVITLWRWGRWNWRRHADWRRRGTGTSDDHGNSLSKINEGHLYVSRTVLTHQRISGPAACPNPVSTLLANAIPVR